MTLSSILEIFAVVSVAPVISILFSSSEGLDSVSLPYISTLLPKDVISLSPLNVAILYALILLVSTFIKVFNIFNINRLSASIGSHLSNQAFNYIMHQDYETHINFKSGDILYSSTVQVNRSIIAVVAFFRLVTSILIVCGLLMLLFAIDRIAFIAISLILSLLYLSIAYLVKRRLNNNSIIINSSYKRIVSSVQEALGSIREVILGSRQKFFVERYILDENNQRILQANSKTLTESPKYLVEAFGILLVLVYAYILINTYGKNSVVPIMGILLMGFQKLLPAFQNIFQSWALINSMICDLEGLITLLGYKKTVRTLIPARSSVPISSSIIFKGVEFTYKNSSVPVFKNLNCELSSGQIIGIKGSTGSGKSTFIDLVSGLLEPTRGVIEIDGESLHHNSSQPYFLQNWYNTVSYVSQNIILNNTSVLENIAFGIPCKNIDKNRVTKAAKIAMVHDFILSLDHGYDTLTGDNGIKLSGGQRQRIAIARAFYFRKNVLILDEATSALDTTTEANIIRNIKELNDFDIVIMVAHRLQTLNICDKIFSLDDGSLYDA